MEQTCEFSQFLSLVSTELAALHVSAQFFLFRHRKVCTIIKSKTEMSNSFSLRAT